MGRPVLIREVQRVSACVQPKQAIDRCFFFKTARSHTASTRDSRCQRASDGDSRPLHRTGRSQHSDPHDSRAQRPAEVVDRLDGGSCCPPPGSVPATGHPVPHREWRPSADGTTGSREGRALFAAGPGGARLLQPALALLRGLRRISIAPVAGDRRGIGRGAIFVDAAVVLSMAASSAVPMSARSAAAVLDALGSTSHKWTERGAPSMRPQVRLVADSRQRRWPDLVEAGDDLLSQERPAIASAAVPCATQSSMRLPCREPHSRLPPCTRQVESAGQLRSEQLLRLLFGIRCSVAIETRALRIWTATCPQRPTLCVDQLSQASPLGGDSHHRLTASWPAISQ